MNDFLKLCKHFRVQVGKHFWVLLKMLKFCKIFWVLFAFQTCENFNRYLTRLKSSVLQNKYWPMVGNFTNILHIAFTNAEPKSTKKTVNSSSFIALLGSARVKADCRMFMKLTPQRRPNVFQRKWIGIRNAAMGKN